MNAHPAHALLLESLRPLRERLLAHPVYSSVQSIEDLRVFMEHHVFAVWDFMSLLKALQRELTCVEVPWVPRGGSMGRRLVNELVLAEESDELTPGEYQSHFELYRAAMAEVGADTGSLESFLSCLSTGQEVGSALDRAGILAPAKVFVLTTFGILDSGSLPAIAAAFTIGREEVIPEMFRQLVADLATNQPCRCELFQSYLARHIQVDELQHGPMARELLAETCGESRSRWQEAERAAHTALLARVTLWDGVCAALGAAHETSASTRC